MTLALEARAKADDIIIGDPQSQTASQTIGGYDAREAFVETQYPARC